MNVLTETKLNHNTKVVQTTYEKYLFFISPVDASMLIIYKSKLSPATESSGPQHLLHHVTGHVVKEQSQDGQQQESSDDLDGQPPVLVTHQVFRSFEGDEEPEEGDVWSAGGT